MKQKFIIGLTTAILCGNITSSWAQDDKHIQIKPDIEYSRTPIECTIGGIRVDGVQNYDDYLLIGISGLSVGQKISLPGEEITQAVKRYWKNGSLSGRRKDHRPVLGKEG